MLMVPEAADIPRTGTPRADTSAGEFKQAMRQLAAAVTIVTTRAEDTCHGMTATAVTSVSANPPALLVCVNRAAHIHPALRVGQMFCVNVLGPSHRDLSLIFGGSISPDLRFGYGEWDQSEHGVPYLRGAPAVFFCKVDLLIDYGTHTVVIAGVDRAVADQSLSPLVYGNGGFQRVTPDLPR